MISIVIMTRSSMQKLDYESLSSLWLSLAYKNLDYVFLRIMSQEFQARLVLEEIQVWFALG